LLFEQTENPSARGRRFPRSPAAALTLYEQPPPSHKPTLRAAATELKAELTIDACRNSKGIRSVKENLFETK